MNAKQNIFVRYELPLFFLLSYLLSWWSAPIMNGQLIPHGPAFAALIVIALTAGKTGLASWWRRLTRLPVAWYWFLIAPAIVISYQAIAYVIMLLSGATTVNPLGLPSMGILTELLLLGGMWEEPGWTGYALPVLLARYAHRQNGPLIAALVLGIFRAIWHLPLFLYGHIFWFDLLFFSMAIQLIIAWLYMRSGGSVLVVMLFHLTSNVMWAVMSPAFEGAALTSFTAWFMGLAVLFAIFLMVRPSRRTAFST